MDKRIKTALQVYKQTRSPEDAAHFASLTCRKETSKQTLVIDGRKPFSRRERNELLLEDAIKRKALTIPETGAEIGMDLVLVVSQNSLYVGNIYPDLRDHFFKVTSEDLQHFTGHLEEVRPVLNGAYVKEFLLYYRIQGTLTQTLYLSEKYSDKCPVCQKEEGIEEEKPGINLCGSCHFRWRKEYPEVCPCCGLQSLEEADSYDICHVCWWEDDGADNEEADLCSGPNGISLTQGRYNYLMYDLSERNRQDLSDRKESPQDYPQIRTFELLPYGVAEPETGWEGNVDIEVA